jgi:hypothetical protein
MIFLQDDESKQQFLVDTDVAVSTLPHRLLVTTSGPSISGTHGESIPCLGEIRHRLTFGLCNFFVTFLLSLFPGPFLV